MSDRASLVRVLTAATGNSTPITLGAAYSQLFMTPAESGAIDGRTYTYLIVDGNNWEMGKGAYTASGTTLARTTILASRISGTLGTTRISLSGTAQVRFIECADDMGALRNFRGVSITSDTIAQSDLGAAINYSNAAAIAVTLPQAGASGQFLDGWATWVLNTGAGTVTITPTTSVINTISTLVLPTNMGAFIWSNGTNYRAFFLPLTKPLLAANNLSDVASAATALQNIAGRMSVVKQKFTSSGTYTPTAGMKYAIIECQGPGGGGGGVAGVAGNSSSGGAGSSGGYSKILVDAATVGASKAVTIGTGGAGGTAGNNAGSAGSGPTSVGSLCVANAGNGGGGSTSGTSAGTAAAGATAGTGDIAIPGSPGFGGFNTTTITIVISGPTGANSFYGVGGLGRSTPGAGNNAGGFGGGGSPAVELNNAANAAGGNGSDGVVYITEFVQN